MIFFKKYIRKITLSLKKPTKLCFFRYEKNVFIVEQGYGLQSAGNVYAVTIYCQNEQKITSRAGIDLQSIPSVKLSSTPTSVTGQAERKQH
jgi:hypothetical protein